MRGTQATEFREYEQRGARSSDLAMGFEARRMKRVLRTQLRCAVCGFTEIRTDEVVDRGLVFLAECPRCDHRWTSAEPIVRYPTVVREVLPAA